MSAFIELGLVGLLTITRKWLSSSEIFSSILFALPYVFAYALGTRIALDLQFDNHAPTGQPFKSQIDDLPNTPIVGNLQLPALFISLAVAAATLLLCGLYGALQNMAAPSDQRKLAVKSCQKRASHTGWAASLNFRKVVTKLSAVALPFYAASIIGGARVALIVLVALFSKILTLDDGDRAWTDIKGWKQLLQYRHWTLLSISAQALSDYVSHAHLVGKAAYATGFLALTISIFALPPPFPSTIRAGPNYEADGPPASGSVVLSSGFETPSIPEVASLKKSTISPLVSSPDEISSTLQAGVASALLCVLTFLLSSISANNLHFFTYGWYILSCCTASACLLLAQPKSVQENKGLGVLAGAMTSTIISYAYDPDIWRLLIIEGFLISLSFLAIQIDMPTLFQSTPKRNQQFDSGHHHSTSHHTHKEAHSRLTRFLLETFQHPPLLHSILAEKDSRRIFYFMRFVVGSTTHRRYTDRKSV